MNLFPVITSKEDRERIQLARERRSMRQNLAAWASAHLKLSREHSAQNPGQESVQPNGARGNLFAGNTGGSKPVV